MKQHIKKYQFILLIGFLFCKATTAQISANLVLNSRPPSYLNDWGNGLAGQLLITNTGAFGPRRVKIATQLKNSSGGILATSNNSTAQVHTINQGANVIRMDRVLQLENLRFTGGGNSLALSGKLMAGEYFLSIQLLSDSNNAPLTQPQERMFTQVNYQLPFLLAPQNEGVLDASIAQTAITFRWSNVLPLSQDAVTYRLQVYEVLELQTPMQALRSNQPILLTDVRRTTQYIWRPQLALKDSAIHQFIWTIQTLDSKGIPITSQDENNQGRSEPRIFTVTNTIKNTLLTNL